MVARTILGVAVVAVLLQNFAVVRTNRQLRDAMDRQARELPVVGDLIPLLVGVDEMGQRKAVGLSGRPKPTIVFTYSPQCPYCRDSLPHWREIASDATRAGLGVVLVNKTSFSDPESARDLLGGTVTLLGDPTHDTYMLLRLRTVPTTLLLNQSGVVEHVWVGAIDSRAAEVKGVIASFAAMGALE